MTVAEMGLVYRSKLEDLMAAVELVFPPTPAFGDYRPYLDHAISHPAKANTKLLEFLILRYTNEGDVILDPMAGSGSTGVVAALYGRNAILVELEPRFYEFIVKAKEKVERAEVLGRKGWIVPICGDARRLSELLISVADVDAVVTSPPYVQQHQGGLDSPEFRHGCIKARYPSRDSIGNLTLGPVDAIITSPPYSEGIGHDPGDNASNEYAWRLELQKRYTRQMVSEGNIAKLRLGDSTDLEGGGDFGQLYKRLLTKKGKPTYLSEMLLVYREMRKVLREEGRAIVIVKPFAKNRKIIDLPHLTYLLMSKVGFSLEALYKLRLEVQSFWRVLYYRKNPDVPRIMHEYVIVAR